MACDTFSCVAANNLLVDKCIYFFGDSNVRALYKDLTWLLEDGRLVPNTMLKTKNEETHANDVRLTNGKLHNGRDYKEVREYTKNCHIRFEFITRLYRNDFLENLRSTTNVPDIVIINSCIWDLTRWGPTGVEQFKTNILETLTYLKSYWTSTRIIWLTVLPPAFKSYGGFLTKDVQFLRKMLPWHVVIANQYAADLAKFLNIDVLDFHYYFRFLLNYHTKDGLHWQPIAMRYATNLLLTHIALIRNVQLPGQTLLARDFLWYSSNIYSHVNNIGKRRRNRKRKNKR